MATTPNFRFRNAISDTKNWTTAFFSPRLSRAFKEIRPKSAAAKER